MPLVRKMAKDLWEVRAHLQGRSARILFMIESNEIVLLLGFNKKSQATPREDLELAIVRLKQLRSQT